MFPAPFLSFGRHPCVVECGDLIERYFLQIVVEVTMVGVGHNQQVLVVAMKL